jgi:hypothetical protein
MELDMANTRKRTARDGTEGVARRIWLAGLGAYGKRIEDAQEQWSKAGDETSRRFQELVDKGQQIEAQSAAVLKKGLSSARGKLSQARERLGEASAENTRPVEEMIARVRRRIGLDESGAQARIDALTGQVHALAQTVSRLTEPKSTRRKSATKPAAASPAPKRKRRTASSSRAKSR